LHQYPYWFLITTISNTFNVGQKVIPTFYSYDVNDSKSTWEESDILIYS